MASFRKRGPQWEAQVRRQGWPAVSKSFSTKAQAQRWASVIESEMTREVFVDRSLLNQLTLGDLLCRYCKEITPTKKGHETEQYRIKALLRDPLSQTRLSDLTGQRIAAWRDQRLAEVTGSTVNRDLNLLSHVCNLARKEWAVPLSNPIGDIRRPKENRARTRRLSNQEEERLLASVKPAQRSAKGRFTGPQNPWIEPLVILALETAMRRSELLSLEWDQTFITERFVRLLDTKNGTSRDVPLSRRACQLLINLPRDASGKVFPISDNAVKLAFTRAVQRAGLRDLHFHDLRHEATTRLSEKLGNVLELSAVTGHKTLSMLKRYYHPKASRLAEKLD